LRRDRRGWYLGDLALVGRGGLIDNPVIDDNMGVKLTFMLR